MNYRATMGQLQTTTRWLRDLAEDTAEKVAAVRHDADLTPDAKRDRVAEIQRDADAEFQRLLADGRRELTEATAAVNTAVKGTSGDPVEQLLHEQREIRAWARVQRVLDTGVSLGDVIREAAEAGDLATLDALDAEIPAWVRAATPRPDQRTARETTVAAMRRKVDEARVACDTSPRRGALEARLEMDDLSAQFDNATHIALRTISTGTVSPADRIRSGYMEHMPTAGADAA